MLAALKGCGHCSRSRAAGKGVPVFTIPPLCAAVCLSPEGRDAREAHIKLPNELLAAYPPHTGDDARSLADIADPKAVDAQ